jgi:YD repeat-containing protein
MRFRHEAGVQDGSIRHLSGDQAKGELLIATDPLRHKTTYEYNSSGQPTVVKNALEKSTTFSYTLGDLTSVADPLGRTTKQYVDGLGRVMSITQPGGSARSTAMVRTTN